MSICLLYVLIIEGGNGVLAGLVYSGCKTGYHKDIVKKVTTLVMNNVIIIIISSY